MKAKLLVAVHMFLEKISGLFQKNNKKELSKSNLDTVDTIKKGGGEDLAESLSSIIEEFSFCFQTVEVVRKEDSSPKIWTKVFFLNSG